MPTTSPRHDQLDPTSLLAYSAVDPVLLLAEAERARSRRRRQRLAAIIGAFVVFALIAGIAAQVGLSDSAPAAGGSAPKVAVKAEALGVLLLRPGRDAERVAVSSPVVGGTTSTSAANGTYSLDGIATVERSSSSAKVSLGRKQASATAGAERIDLFDGRVQLTTASLTATARSGDGRAAGTLELAPATTLTVDGVERPAALNERIAIEGIGTVIVNEQAVLASVPRGDAQTGPRHRVVGAIAHVRITHATNGVAAGTELIIGRVDAGVREGKVKQVEHPGAGSVPLPTAPGTLPGVQAGAPKPGEGALPRRSSTVRGTATGGGAGSLQGYLFPVLGNSSFTNDWGGARASTSIPHQGTDIFAAEGTPIVAIADGVLDRVGWNSIGGYRFWLFDKYGNSFYFAHLSAFSPLAQDGARVRRGDVIGFVGNTGDAQFTPPHLHFEVHPGNGAPTNPFTFLGAWQKGVAAAIGLVTGGSGAERVAPLALLGFSDISANSGLQDSVLESVPDTRQRSIEQETEPRPTDESLTGAIDGPGISG